MGLFSFGDNSINMAEFLLQINNDLPGISIGDNVKRRYLELEWRLSKMLVFARQFDSRHGIEFLPEQKANLELIIVKLAELVGLAKRMDSVKIKEEIEKLTKQLNGIFDTSAVYLVRHPEPPLESYQANFKGANLTPKGMLQASKFAEHISNEVLFCPKRVNVYLFFTSKPRTRIMAEAVSRKLNQILMHKGKHVEIIVKQERPELYADALPALASRYPEMKQISENVKARGVSQKEISTIIGYFKIYVAEFSSAKKYGLEINRLLHWGANLSSAEQWNIVICFSHEHTIATYLHHVLGIPVDECFVETTEFAKRVGERTYYRGQWY